VQTEQTKKCISPYAWAKGTSSLKKKKKKVDDRKRNIVYFAVNMCVSLRKGFCFKHILFTKMNRIEQQAMPIQALSFYMYKAYMRKGYV